MIPDGTPKKYVYGLRHYFTQWFSAGCWIGTICTVLVIYHSLPWFKLAAGSEIYCDEVFDAANYSLWAWLVGIPCCIGEGIWSVITKRQTRLWLAGVGLLINALSPVWAFWLFNRAIVTQHLRGIA